MSRNSKKITCGCYTRDLPEKDVNLKKYEWEDMGNEIIKVR